MTLQNSLPLRYTCLQPPTKRQLPVLERDGGMSCEDAAYAETISEFLTCNVKFVLSRVGVTIHGVLDWMIGFTAPYIFTQLGTTGNTALSQVYTLHSSPL
jgi:hypothetical protein